MMRELPRRGGAALLVAVLTLLPLGCERGDAKPSPLLPHPLAANIAKVRDRLTGLDEEEAASVDGFLARSDPNAAVYQVRRICGFLGKGMVDVAPAEVGEFVLAAASNLYDNFFRAFDDEKLGEIADSLRNQKGMGEVELLKIEAVIRMGRGAYNGTLTRALKDVPFEDAVAPRRLSVSEVEPGDKDDIETFTAAAEILRLESFILEGAQPDRSIRTYHRALLKWPNDPVLVAGLVTVYLENEGHYGKDLGTFLEKASTLDAENGLYDYLRAARLLRVGKDDLAVDTLQTALMREKVSFHGLERAQRTRAYLERKGYGPIRARLSAYRAASVAGYFELKDIVNRAIQRSYEYERAGDKERVQTLLQIPVVLDRQIKKGPHMLMGEVVRISMLASGLRRLSELEKSEDLAQAGRTLDRAEGLLERLTTIESGTRMCGGPAALGRINDLVGEKDFIKFLDGVLYGNEAEFLLRAGECETLEDVVPLTQQAYPFD